MFATIEDAEPDLLFPPPPKEFLFFNDLRNGEVRSAGRYGDIVATVAAALSEARGAPPLPVGATCLLVDTGPQSTCTDNFASFGVTQKTPPTGEFGLSFAWRQCTISSYETSKGKVQHGSGSNGPEDPL